MRYDYKYIKKAISIEVTTTTKGDEEIERLVKEYDAEPFEATRNDPMADLLLTLQDNYVTLPPGSVAGVEEVVATVRKYIANEFDGENIDANVIRKAWNDNLIGIEVVIWDDEGLRCFVHGVVDSFICETPADLASEHVLTYDGEEAKIVRNHEKDHWNLWRVK